jgi:hypothetical protein
VHSSRNGMPARKTIVSVKYEQEREDCGKPVHFGKGNRIEIAMKCCASGTITPFKSKKIHNKLAPKTIPLMSNSVEF